MVGEHIKYDLFPTHIVRSKCPSITPQDKKEMMDNSGLDDRAEDVY
jgi:hypothetical protein